MRGDRAVKGQSRTPVPTVFVQPRGLCNLGMRVQGGRGREEQAKLLATSGPYQVGRNPVGRCVVGSWVQIVRERTTTWVRPYGVG